MVLERSALEKEAGGESSMLEDILIRGSEIRRWLLVVPVLREGEREFVLIKLHYKDSAYLWWILSFAGLHGTIKYATDAQ